MTCSHPSTILNHTVGKFIPSDHPQPCYAGIRHLFQFANTCLMSYQPRHHRGILTHIEGGDQYAGCSALYWVSESSPIAFQGLPRPSECLCSTPFRALANYGTKHPSFSWSPIITEYFHSTFGIPPITIPFKLSMLSMPPALSHWMWLSIRIQGYY